MHGDWCLKSREKNTWGESVGGQNAEKRPELKSLAEEARRKHQNPLNSSDTLGESFANQTLTY